MVEFHKYQHVERFGNDEVEGIEIGECFVFPKIDGTNSSLWLDENKKLCAGSRNRQLTLDYDNAGFFNAMINNTDIINLLLDNSNLRLFGEWLVKHSLGTYKDDAWRVFYVFDVIENIGDDYRYLPYKEYKPLLEKYNISYIPCQAIIKNPTYDNLLRECGNNTFLIKDGEGVGEGILIKNYQYENKYGRKIWAKIVTNEFKQKQSKVMGPKELQGSKMIEEEIVEDFLTNEMIEKTYNKILIENDNRWDSKMIPRLLNTVYHDFIVEEIWEIIKKHKNPKINFKTLLSFVNYKIKECKKELF